MELSGRMLSRLRMFRKCGSERNCLGQAMRYIGRYGSCGCF